MSHETAKILYQASHEAQQKFEYFLTGAIGAMFAYTVQTYTPKKLGMQPSTLEFMAILCLAGAFIFGLRRLACFHPVLNLKSHQTAALEDADTIRSSLRQEEPDRHLLSPELEKNFQSWESALLAKLSYAKSAEPLLSGWNVEAKKTHSWRARLMILGFALIVASRAMTPYFEPTTPQKPQTPAQATTHTDQKAASDPKPPK